MRIFSIIVAVLSLIASAAHFVILPRFSAMFHDMDQPLSTVTRMILTGSGLFPGGVLLALGVLILFLIAIKQAQASVVLSIPSLVFLLFSVVFIPFHLLKELDQTTRNLKRPKEQPATQQ